MDPRARSPEEAAGLRVGLFAPGWPPSAFSNGIVTYLDHLRAGLTSLGHESRVLALATGDAPLGPEALGLADPAYADGRARRLRSRIESMFRPEASVLASRTARRLSRGLDSLSENWPIDLFEMEESFGIAGLVRTRDSIPNVVRLHGPWSVNGLFYDVPRDSAFHARCGLERRAALAADGISVPAQHLLESAREAWESPLPEAAVIGNPAPGVPVEQRWSLQSAKPGRLLFVGRFDRIKGADVLIEGFARLAERRPEVELLFVGPDEGLVTADGRSFGLADYLDAELEPAARARVQVMGVRSPAEIADLRREAAVTLLTSRHEVFPLTALEAMSFGCPLVASRIPGVEECAEHERNALLFTPGDSGDLVHQLERVLDAPEWGARLGAQAAPDVEARFSPRAVAVATSDFYREVLARSAKRSSVGGARR